ncbi:MAG: CRISPR-associated protein Csm7 [Magnetococcales bacterium]|nr:CRISPR-associated protein Csm7 [Magnetococcales bacterium]
MKTLLLTLQPLTAFATPPHGDTLFGQLCWALRHRMGETWLSERLRGYADGDPFLVVSDLLPAGYWPRPALPPAEGADDKEEKKRNWLPRQEWHRPLAEWLTHCDAEKNFHPPGRTNRPHPHNAINRLTGTTGKAGFAPYAVEQSWFPPESRLELWLLHDPQRVDQETILAAVGAVGLTGFGKDASIGLGKFSVESVAESALPRQEGSNAWLTLGFCAPQGLGFDARRSFYHLFTRFGRHGDVAALTGSVFKSPILLARAGAVLTPPAPLPPPPFAGQGLGGNGTISKAIPAAVHQGYAPVAGIRVDWEAMNHG